MKITLVSSIAQRGGWLRSSDIYGRPIVNTYHIELPPTEKWSIDPVEYFAYSFSNHYSGIDRVRLTDSETIVIEYSSAITSDEKIARWLERLLSTLLVGWQPTKTKLTLTPTKKDDIKPTIFNRNVLNYMPDESLTELFLNVKTDGYWSIHLDNYCQLMKTTFRNGLVDVRAADQDRLLRVSYDLKKTDQKSVVDHLTDWLKPLLY